MNHINCVMKCHVYPQKMHSCSNNIRGLSFFVLKISMICQEKVYHRCYCTGIPLVERWNCIWHVEKIICLISLLDCGRPVQPKFGFVSLNDTTFNSKAYISCKDGYSVEGNTIAVCQSDGTWSVQEPSCIMIGNILFSSTVFGENLRYCHSLGVVVMQKTVTFCNYSECVFTFQKAIHTIKGNHSKYIFF